MSERGNGSAVAEARWEPAETEEGRTWQRIAAHERRMRFRIAATLVDTEAQLAAARSALAAVREVRAAGVGGEAS